jgi:hypothetical protein
MNKALSLILLFLTVVGIIGGIGYSIYNGAWVIAIGLCIAGYVAWPGVVGLFKKLTE